MATGACGISCDVCRLHVVGVCSTCGPGNSTIGKEKLAAQMRIFGAGCPILACAAEKELGHCTRDCDQFPCQTFSDGPHPYSKGFLQMQGRRRAEAAGKQAVAWPENTELFWERLGAKTREEICADALARPGQGETIQVQALGETWTCDPSAKTVVKEQGAFGGEWDRQAPFLILVYLATASPGPLAGELTAPRDLYAGQDFFQGRYRIKTTELESAFGRDAAKMLDPGKALGGKLIDGADAGLRIHVFPKLPVDVLIWEADEEFSARATVLMDRRTPEHYPSDACAIVVNLMLDRLLTSE
jgi:Domain of unknown function (DUF3786)